MRGVLSALVENKIGSEHVNETRFERREKDKIVKLLTPPE